MVNPPKIKFATFFFFFRFIIFFTTTMNNKFLLAFIVTYLYFASILPITSWRFIIGIVIIHREF